MLSTIITSCIAAVIEILTNFTAYLKNKSANTDLTDYEKNRKLQEEIDKHNEEIRRCGCPCHQPEVHLMHCAPCCSVTYQKPIKIAIDNDTEN